MDSNVNNFPIQEKVDDIKIPQIKYRKVSYIDADKVFTGDIVPIPSVLIDYLDKYELKAFSIVLRQIRETGHCIVRLESMAKNLDVSYVSISAAMTRLKKMGIIDYHPYGRNREKTINFNTIQILHDFLKDAKPGATSALRKKAANSNINKLPDTAIKYIETNYRWHDDPLEDEEYD